MMIIFRSKLGLCVHSWFYMYYSFGVRKVCCSVYWVYACTAGFICYRLWSKEPD